MTKSFVRSEKRKDFSLFGCIHCSNEDSLEDHIKHLVYLTFRDGFFPTRKGTSTDKGFGCMIRSGAMLVANSFQRLLFGENFLPNWRTLATCPRCRWLDSQFGEEIIQYTRDHHTFSIQHLIEVGDDLGFAEGTWWGPSTFAFVFQRLFSAYLPNNALTPIYVTDPGINTIFLPDVKKLFLPVQNRQPQNISSVRRPIQSIPSQTSCLDQSCSCCTKEKSTEDLDISLLRTIYSFITIEEKLNSIEEPRPAEPPEEEPDMLGFLTKAVQVYENHRGKGGKARIPLDSPESDNWDILDDDDANESKLSDMKKLEEQQAGYKPFHAIQGKLGIIERRPSFVAEQSDLDAVNGDLKLAISTETIFDGESEEEESEDIEEESSSTPIGILILVPLTLSLTLLPPSAILTIQEMFRSVRGFCGFAGGTPTKGVYVIGWTDDKFICLDPHSLLQSSIETSPAYWETEKTAQEMASQAFMPTFSQHVSSKRLITLKPCKDFDPTLCLGFIARNEDELKELREQIEQVFAQTGESVLFFSEQTKSAFLEVDTVDWESEEEESDIDPE
ncbi:Cysteine protease ATG4C [Blattamonas nauphoetae]|uniref:Cysteine protease n=1 Tax=Blattamonas nauphoetae TaxID=2049346 RepID=A0ABQ9XBC5_9EUKA|nr:Cysteine protease ATG4C [Blattamonas nauphoetae]